MTTTTGSEVAAKPAERKITITQALSKLKALNSELNAMTAQLPEQSRRGFIFVGLAIGEGDKRRPFGGGSVTVAEQETNMKANLQKVNAVYQNYMALKQAVVISNATTVIDVDGVQMLMSSAIVLKSMLPWKKALLTALVNEYGGIVQHHQNAQNNCDLEVSKIKKTPIDESTATPEMVKVLEEMHANAVAARIADLKPSLIDPNKIESEISKLKAEVLFIETELDSLITISNSKTFIDAL